MIAIMLIFLNMVSAAPASYKTPDMAIKDFLSPYSATNSKSLNGKTQDPNIQELNSELKSDVKVNGVVRKQTLVDSDSRLSGNMQTFVYELEFANGKKKKVNFIVIRPSLSGDFFIMKASKEE